MTNHGPGTSSLFSVTDVVPAGVTDVDTSDSRCTVAGNTVRCVGTRLDVGASTDIVVTGTVPMTDDDCAVNSASVHANEVDPNQANNTSNAVQTCVGDLADLSIHKSVSPSPATPGRDVTYTLQVHNAGPDLAEHVVVSDPLPAGLSFVSASRRCAFSGGV